MQRSAPRGIPKRPSLWLVPAAVLFLSLNPAAAQWMELRATGQVQCWSEEGVQRDCEGTGEDGDTRTGVPWTDGERFSDLGDGTVKDQLTGLSWLKDAGCITDMGWETGSTERLTWEGALDAVKALNAGQRACDGYAAGAYDAGAYDDWRLPNINELQSLFIHGGVADTQKWLRDQAFPRIPSIPRLYDRDSTNAFWSSTTFPYIFYDRAWMWYQPEWRPGDADKSGATGGAAIAWPVRGAATRVMQTGQSECWNEINHPIECAVTGQDGEWQAGVQPPQPRFRRLGDGTFVDAATGLMWLRNPRCFADVSWQQALDGIRALNGSASGLCAPYSGNYSDWRLPNLIEMLSIFQQRPRQLDNYEPRLRGLLVPLELADVLDYVPPTEHDAHQYLRQLFWSSTTDTRSPVSANDNKQAQALAVIGVLGVQETTLKTSAGSQHGYNHNAWPVRSLRRSDTGVAPQLVAVPEGMRFDTLAPRTLTDRYVTLRNNGVLPLELTEIGELSLPFSVDSACRRSLEGPPVRVLGMDQSCRVHIRFWPTDLGTFVDTLAIKSIDAETRTALPVLSLPVSGVAERSQAPDVVVSTPEGVSVRGRNLMFGTLGLGDPPEVKIVEVYNEGIEPLEIVLLRGLRAPFSADHDCGQIETASLCGVRITFAPTVREHLGTQQQTLVIATNDPWNGNTEVSVIGTGSPWPNRPVARVTGEPDFGLVTVGQQGRRSFTVRNEGREALELEAVSVEQGSSFELTDDRCSGQTLQRIGDECEFVIGFNPDDEGTASGALSITSNDQQSPWQTELRGEGFPEIPRIALKRVTPLVVPFTEEQRIELSDGVLKVEFGNVQAGRSSTVTLEVRNAGGGSLLVQHIDIQSSQEPKASGSHTFAVETDRCTHVALAHDSACRITLKFTAPSDGLIARPREYHDLLRIISNDPVLPSLDVEVIGSSSQTP